MFEAKDLNTGYVTVVYVEANPSKFKFMVFSKTSHIYDSKINERTIVR